MKLQTFMANAYRRLDTMFPGVFQTPKHNHKADFGWPQTLVFQSFYEVYTRNGIASAAVSKTVLKTWQENPELWETEDSKETTREKEIADHFRKIRFWQMLAEADRRSLVGGYAAVILRLADSKTFREPVDTVAGGIESLVEVVPVWAGQLKVASWESDERSPDYGKPTMFSFNEASVQQNVESGATKQRAFEVHPDRVVIWSADGTVHCRSGLEPGYNDLIDLEKVKGAGGEGFWKNARSAPVIEIDKEAKLEEMARSMNVSLDELVDKMGDQVRDYQKGFDEFLMFQGMTAKQLAVTLPSPEHFWNVPLQSFAASFGIPLKILVGSQTGERASTEDARDWAQTCNARRENQIVPTIESIIERLIRVGILADLDWKVHWPDLTESTAEEKLARAERMSSINAKNPDMPVFLPEEIRETVDMEPLTAAQLAGMGDDGEESEDDNLEDEGEQPPPGNEPPENQQ